jgi:hypothetical protein
MQPIRQAKIYMTLSLTQAKILEVTRILKKRDAESRKLEGALKTFCNSVADKYQPAQKLYDVIIHAARKAAAATLIVDIFIANLAIINIVPALARDRRVIIDGRMV